jgi:hypothetical protein
MYSASGRKARVTPEETKMMVEGGYAGYAESQEWREKSACAAASR